METTKAIPNAFASMVDGLNLVDGGAIKKALLNLNSASSTYNIAASGNNSLNATQLYSVLNQIDLVPSSSGVNLPLSTGAWDTPCQMCVVSNNTLNELNVYAYPNSSDLINNTNGETGVSIPPNTAFLYISIEPGSWISIGGVAGNSSAGIYNFLDYPGSISGIDVTTAAQNFLLWCQLQAYALSTTTHDNLLQREFVTAYFPRGKWVLTSPLIVPEFVNIICDGELIRSRNPGGNPNLMTYNGDTTSNANYNLFFPALILVPRAHATQGLNILCNADGINSGSGMLCNKNWTASTVSLSNPGSGYSVNDVLTFAQPSKMYYTPIQVTVNSVNGSGAILTYTLSQTGAYSLAPFLQQQQWIAANGFTGAIANGTPGQVFDGVTPGAFITSGGTGLGASFTVSWTPDWSTGNDLYNTGAFLVTDTLLGSIRIQGIGNSFSSTFGPMYGFWASSGNFEIDHIQTGGGNIGIYIRGASDIRANSLNAVDAETNMVVFAMGSFECDNIVLDTCTANTFFTIDQCDGALLKIHCLMPPTTTGTLASGCVGSIGLNSSGASTCANIAIEINATNCGTEAGAPMLKLGNAKGSRIQAFASNYGLGGGINLNLINGIASFATGWDTSNIIEGSCDNISGNLFSGTIPNCYINIWDDQVKGVCKNLSIYEIFGVGAPTNGVTGAGKAAVNSTYIDTSSSSRYKNTGTMSSPAWTIN